MSVSLSTALARIAHRMPDAPALHFACGSMTFAELDELARRYAAGFERIGIRRGDRMAIWLPNTPDWLGAFFGSARLGAIALLTNTRFRSAEIGDLLARTEARTIIYQPDFRSIDFSGVLKECLPHLPNLQTIIAVGAMTDALPGRPVLNTEFLLDGRPMDRNDGTADAPCLLFTTSGTTKRPKLVMHTHESVMAHAADVASGFGFADDTAGTLQMLPLCGTYGFTQAMANLLAGRPLAMHATFDAEVASMLIARHGIRRAALTDEMVRRICALPSSLPRGFNVIIGSRAQGLVPVAEEHHLKITGIYGSSEVQALFSRRQSGRSTLEMAAGGGQPVSAEAQVRARDPDTGQLCAPGEAGELEIQGPSVTMGYFGDQEATATAFTSDGFFRTGDLGTVEADGSFTYLTRFGEAFRVNGFLVNPAEIDAVVLEHPMVNQCQTVAVEQGGKAHAVAFVIAQDRGSVPEQSLRDFCVARMATYKVPVRFVRVDEFPVIESANNTKIHRAKLRDMAAALLG
ncbi:AMP-binding protein [Roseomonas terrae]|uniref:Long-chain-fatty-acid--CoA ligase n=1 Tax=Neoroseomonas terrae TaxID=424799 RepID=A0ABS5EQ61_9PROT|nr:AMP-binding protein [Neoroseomonas terrae]MBR0653171.1 AMP-binding protein [Neoroseomonas terrae]